MQCEGRCINMLACMKWRLFWYPVASMTCKKGVPIYVGGARFEG